MGAPRARESGVIGTQLSTCTAADGLRARRLTGPPTPPAPSEHKHRLLLLGGSCVVGVGQHGQHPVREKHADRFLAAVEMFGMASCGGFAVFVCCTAFSLTSFPRGGGRPPTNEFFSVLKIG